MTPEATQASVDIESGSKSRSSSSPKKAADESESTRSNGVPQIVVKKEPSSPEPPAERHRPPKLHLAKGVPGPSGGTPRTGLADKSLMQEVGMACLSPGFATHDPTMREQLQRSISVRDQQRSIIESRLQRHARATESNPESNKNGREEPPSTSQGDRSIERAPGSARRKPPSNLTIVPPPHRAFANERIVQSAPLNQSFTGRNQPPPHLSHQPFHNGFQNQHHQVNRLPPITDVFAAERLDSSRTSRPDPNKPYFSASRPSYPSPNSLSNRPREYRSAEEAVASMAGGREDLLPRIVHYGGHQPPTPPSPPMPPSSQHQTKVPPINGVTASSTGRRRGRDEYERDGSYGSDSDAHPDAKRRKEDDRRKRAEFLDLCARAWDLLHS